MDPKSPTVEDVKAYWQSHPLYSYEVADVGSDAFFIQLDRIKLQDVETFALPFWQFDQFKGRAVLDVGCGPGWFTVQYAVGGARVSAVDLTPAAVDLTKKHLKFKKTDAHVQEGNAESLPFGNESFDLVISAGVLHHTPNTPQAFQECFRVLKRGGRAKIALYRKGLIHSPVFFPVTRTLMKLLKVKHPGADLAKDASSVDDFIRQYDGSGNPVGIGKTDAEWQKDLEKTGFNVEKRERHFFPRRLIPLGRFIPNVVHKLLNDVFGTLVYFELTRPF